MAGGGTTHPCAFFAPFALIRPLHRGVTLPENFDAKTARTAKEDVVPRARPRALDDGWRRHYASLRVLRALRVDPAASPGRDAAGEFRREDREDREGRRGA